MGEVSAHNIRIHRLTGESDTPLIDSFEGRDAMLSSGMEVGVNDGYARLDQLLAGGEV